MYMCVRSTCIDFASFYDFSIGFWNCSDGVVIFVFHFIYCSTSLMGLSLPWCCHVCVFHMSKISDSSPNFVSDDLCFVLNQHTILDWCSATFCFWWSLFCTEPTHCFLIGVVLHFVSDDLCFVLDQHTVLDWCSATFCFWWSLFCTGPTHCFGLVQNKTEIIRKKRKHYTNPKQCVGSVQNRDHQKQNVALHQSKIVCWFSTKQRSSETKLGLKSEILLKCGKHIHDSIRGGLNP
jgi:hypothetical protein